MKRVILKQEYESGGVKMLDICMMQKGFLRSWCSKIYNNRNANFTVIPSWLLKPCVPSSDLSIVNTLFENLCPQECVQRLPEFYKEVMKEFLQNKSINAELNVHDMIWNNALIQYRGNVLNFEGWTSVGIVYLNQILDNEQNILPYDVLLGLVKNKASFLFEYNALKHALKRSQIRNIVKLEYKVNGTHWCKAKCRDYIRDFMIKM